MTGSRGFAPVGLCLAFFIDVWLPPLGIYERIRSGEAGCIWLGSDQFSISVLWYKFLAQEKFRSGVYERLGTRDPECFRYRVDLEVLCIGLGRGVGFNCPQLGP